MQFPKLRFEWVIAWIRFANNVKGLAMSFMLDTTPEQRLIEGLRLSEELRLDTIASIRRQNPDYSENEVKLAYIRHICTDEEFYTLLPVIEEWMKRDRPDPSGRVAH